MKPNDIRTVIEEATTTSLQRMYVPGIVAAELKELTISLRLLQRLSMAIGISEDGTNPQLSV